MDRNTILPSFLAFANASGPQGYQSTGLWACMSKYGLVSRARRLVGCSFSFLRSGASPGQNQRTGTLKTPLAWKAWHSRVRACYHPYLDMDCPVSPGRYSTVDDALDIAFPAAKILINGRRIFSWPFLGKLL